MDAIGIIIREVAAQAKITPEQMLEPTHRRSVVRPRQIAMTIARDLTPHSLPTLAKRFNGKHHTTVMWGIRRIAKLRAADPGFDAAMSRMMIRCASAIKSQRERLISWCDAPEPNAPSPFAGMGL